jgi:hypothetical protein
MLLQRTSGRPAQAASVALAGTAMLMSAAGAAASSEPFVFVAYSNSGTEAPPASGDYLRASQDVYAHTATPSDPQALDTNRCVALTMQQQLAQARRACDAAVADTRSAADGLLGWNAHMQQQASAAAAVAYSNRAVMHWLDADPQAAQEDLQKAQALAPQASFVMRNLSALRAHQGALKTTATAQLTPAAPE